MRSEEFRFFKSGRGSGLDSAASTALVGKKADADSDDQLVVALDFGTTFSGIAYAFKTKDKPDVISILDWPGLRGRKQPKVPTAICYGTKDKDKFTWGAEQHATDVVQGIKLLLDPDQPRPIYLPQSTAKADAKRLGKPVVDVAADFIGAMYEHAMAKIKSTVPAEYVDMCQKHFVLSVPAVWSDKAKARTLQAAEKAGIHPVSLIKEPEAAAMYTLHMLKDRALEVGDAFVICDAGGGTVDLISYEINRLSPRLELKELVPGKGGMAGSLGLNKRFEAAVKELVGEDQYHVLRKSKGFRLATEYFDQSVKTAFRGDEEEEYYVNFPMANLEDDDANNLSSNCWTMSGSDVKSIFDPLIADIERLVDEQVQAVMMKRLSEDHAKADKVKAIFLVGGFGSSEYLKMRLEMGHPGIQVIQPHDSWAAIVKGAVLSQLPQEALITSNQATRHYGVSATITYNPVIDAGKPKYWDAALGEQQVSRMTWYITRGDDLLRDQKIRFPFYRRLPADFPDADLIFSDKLLQSESKVPPIHPSAATKTNCTLVADLRTVDRKLFTKMVGVDGFTYYEVSYDLAITIKSAVMKFSLEVKGKEMGAVDARYD